MKKKFLPYYLSRAIASIAFALLFMGMTWKALFLAALFFGLFLLYLHSGWFTIDLRNPLLPLRRDPRGQEVQRKALIIAVVAGVLFYFLSPAAAGLIPVSLSGNAALSIGVFTYFIAQFVLFIRA